MHQATARLAGVTVAAGATHPRRLEDILEPTIDRMEKAGATNAELPPGSVGFGIAELDAALGGIQPGELALIAGRPLTGATEAITTLILSVAQAGEPVVLISPRHPAETWCERLISAAGQVPLGHIRSGRMTEDDWNRAVRSSARLGVDLVIDDASVQTPATILTTCHAFKPHGGGMIVVDDLHQIAADIDGANLYESTAGIARALKILARDTGMAVVATCSLNRGPEQRVDKRPSLVDLRGAGDLEDIADHVILMRCDETYDPTTDRLGEVDLVVSKTPTGPGREWAVTCALQRHYSRIVPLLS